MRCCVSAPSSSCHNVHVGRRTSALRVMSRPVALWRLHGTRCSLEGSLPMLRVACALQILLRELLSTGMRADGAADAMASIVITAPTKFGGKGDGVQTQAGPRRC